MMLILFLPLVLALRFSEVQSLDDVHLFDTDDDGSILLTSTESGLINLYALQEKYQPLQRIDSFLHHRIIELKICYNGKKVLVLAAYGDEMSLNIFRNSKDSPLYALKHKVTNLPISEGKYDDVELAVDGEILMIVKANLQFTKFQLVNNTQFVQVQNVTASCEGAVHLTRDLDLFEMSLNTQKEHASILIHDDQNESALIRDQEQATRAQLFLTDDYKYLAVSEFADKHKDFFLILKSEGAQNFEHFIKHSHELYASAEEKRVSISADKEWVAVSDADYTNIYTGLEGGKLTLFQEIERGHDHHFSENTHFLFVSGRGTLTFYRLGEGLSDMEVVGILLAASSGACMLCLFSVSFCKKS